MEQYFPIIIAVAALIYRVYTNFVKEQEKARNRNPAQRPADMQPGDRSVMPPFEYEYHPEPDLVEETFSPERPYEPVYKHIKSDSPTREIYKEEKYQPMVVKAFVANKYEEENAQEVILGKAIHSPHKHGLKAENEKHLNQDRSEYADFDIHDAVIKSAILNRPEY